MGGGTVAPKTNKTGYCRLYIDYVTVWAIRGSDLGRRKRFSISRNSPDRLLGPTQAPIHLSPVYFNGGEGKSGQDTKVTTDLLAPR